MVVVIHVKLKLAEVLVCELAGLEIYDHVALEDCVIENQVDVEMVAIQSQSLLPGDERESLAQFQQKCLHVVDQRLFKIGFDESRRLRQPQELHDDRVFEDIRRPLDILALGRQLHQSLLVRAESQPLVQQAVLLSLQLTGRPIVLDRLDLIKGSGLRLIDAEQSSVVGP